VPPPENRTTALRWLERKVAVVVTLDHRVREAGDVAVLEPDRTGPGVRPGCGETGNPVHTFGQHAIERSAGHHLRITPVDIESQLFTKKAPGEQFLNLPRSGCCRRHARHRLRDWNGLNRQGARRRDRGRHDPGCSIQSAHAETWRPGNDRDKGLYARAGNFGRFDTILLIDLVLLFHTLPPVVIGHDLQASRCFGTSRHRYPKGSYEVFQVRFPSVVSDTPR
jgi:hypothetical protein